jgi:hypothetical protein
MRCCDMAAAFGNHTSEIDDDSGSPEPQRSPYGASRSAALTPYWLTPIVQARVAELVWRLSPLARKVLRLVHIVLQAFELLDCLSANANRARITSPA